MSKNQYFRHLASVGFNVKLIFFPVQVKALRWLYERRERETWQIMLKNKSRGRTRIRNENMMLRRNRYFDEKPWMHETVVTDIVGREMNLEGKKT